jgi:hypothetical protein
MIPTEHHLPTLNCHRNSGKERGKRDESDRTDGANEAAVAGETVT